MHPTYRIPVTCQSLLRVVSKKPRQLSRCYRQRNLIRERGRSCRRCDQRHGFDLRIHVLTRAEAQYLLRASRHAGEELRSSFSMADGDQHIDLRLTQRLNVFHPHRHDIEDRCQRRTIHRQADVGCGDPDPVRRPCFADSPGTSSVSPSTSSAVKPSAGSNARTRACRTVRPPRRARSATDCRQARHSADRRLRRVPHPEAPCGRRAARSRRCRG